MTPSPAHFVRRRILRTIGAVGAVLLLALGAVGAHVFTASAATLYPLAYNPFMQTPVPANAQLVGQHDANAPLTVELILHPQHEAEIAGLIQHLTTKGDAQYRHWLSSQQFFDRYAPPAFDVRWLTDRGLHEIAGPSPLVRVFQGTTHAVEAAFHTTINDYRTLDGKIVYANSTMPELPLTMQQYVGGVVGLDNVLAGKIHPKYLRPHALPNGKVPRYGAAPGGNGLTPAQIRGIYSANGIYSTTTGQGSKLAVYELSNYTQPDITAYENAFGIPHVPLVNVNVDGGPGSDHSGAGEVELDIEFQLALAPGIAKMEVYNAPNTNAGGLDEYFVIANQDSADAISTSWGLCEPESSASIWFGEYLAFSEMAIQGQSIFSAAGDSGEYDCEFLATPPFPSFTTLREVDDPSSNPYMTAVGGTSFFGTYDPGSNLHPTYPAGKEYVWNTFNNCLPTDFTFQGTNLGLCPFGAGGGGDSRVWAMPFYQSGPGVISSYSESGGFCQHDPTGAGKGPCRELPDVSINADPNSGYALYCTDVAGGCVGLPGEVDNFSLAGGTSCAAPLWAAIAALADSYGHERIGLVNADLYNLDNASGFAQQLHDMTGGGHYTFQGVSYVTNRNGANSGPELGFPETSAYDMATGVGTPNITNLAKSLS